MGSGALDYVWPYLKIKKGDRGIYTLFLTHTHTHKGKRRISFYYLPSSLFLLKEKIFDPNLGTQG